MKYNYLAALEEDIIDWCNYEHFHLSDYDTVEEAHEYLNNALWDDDSVTGNGGNYYNNEYNCEEFLSHNLERVMIACENFCIDIETLLNHLHSKDLTRYLDCLVRLDLLDAAIENVLNNWINKEKENA